MIKSCTNWLARTLYLEILLSTIFYMLFFVVVFYLFVKNLNIEFDVNILKDYKGTKTNYRTKIAARENIVED